MNQRFKIGNKSYEITMSGELTFSCDLNITSPLVARTNYFYFEPLKMAERLLVILGITAGIWTTAGTLSVTNSLYYRIRRLMQEFDNAGLAAGAMLPQNLLGQVDGYLFADQMCIYHDLDKIEWIIDFGEGNAQESTWIGVDAILTSGTPLLYIWFKYAILDKNTAIEVPY